MLRPFTPGFNYKQWEHELLHSYCLLNNTALKLQTGTKQSVIGPTKNNPRLMKSLKKSILEEKEV